MSLVPTLRDSTIEDWGAIRSVSAPPDWRSINRNSAIETAPQEKTWFISPDDEQTTINFYFRGQQVGQDLSANLAAALEKGPHQLSPDEIVSLKHVLGTKNVGSNQYTVQGELGTFNYAACRIVSAAVIDLNGHPVVSVRCTFQDENAAPINEVQGIYFESAPASCLVQQIWYEAPTLQQFERHLSDYDAMLASITWK